MNVNEVSSLGWLDDDLFKSLTKVLYLALGLVLLVWFFHLIWHVLLASVLALILAIALNAPVTLLERRNVPRAAGTAISFLGVLAISGGVGWMVVPRLAEEIPVLIGQIPDLLESLIEAVGDVIGDQPEVQQELSRVVDWALGLFDGLWQYADVVLGSLALGIFVIALALYMVVYLRSLLAWYVRTFAPSLRDQATRAFARASRMVIGWVFATIILGSIKAVAVFIFLTVAGVEGAIVWTVLAFFGAFVPQVGFYVMTIPPVLMIFAEDPMLALWTFLYYAVFSELLGRFVAPWIYAEAMELNAVYVLFMIIAVGYAFGLVGVLIATPVAGFIKAYFDEFYLNQQPADEKLDEKVEVMMQRDVEWRGTEMAGSER